MVLTPLVLENEYPLLGVGTPIGFISLVLTDKDPSEIMQAYTKFAELTDDTLPAMAWDLSEPDPIFDTIVKPFELFHKALKEFHEACEPFLETPTRTQFQIEMTLDDLLDMVNERGGVDQLTTEEFKLLQKLSAQ
jgi:hypothetical protein